MALLGPLRRSRLLLVVLVIAGIFLLFSSSTPPAQDTSEFPSDTAGHQWGDHDLVDDQVQRPAVGDRWKNIIPTWKKKDRAVLITGGAGSMGHSLAPVLIKEGYAVHALDIVARPATLPAGVIYHRANVLTGAKQVLEDTNFEGVIHFAGVSLDQWCAPKQEECEKVNVGGTKVIMDTIEEKILRVRRKGTTLIPWSKGETIPWVLFASSMDVYGSAAGGKPVDESTAQKPETGLGKTKARAEDVVRDAYARAQRGATAIEVDDQAEADEDDSKPSNTAQLKVAIVRFADVYGYHRSMTIPSAFFPRLVQHAVTSLPIQYSSDHAPMDLLHIGDAIRGLLEVVKRLDAGASTTPSLESYNLVHGGKRWLQEEIVNTIRGEVQSLSPVRDIGDHKVQVAAWSEFSNKAANENLGWKPEIELPYGLAQAVVQLASDAAEYTSDFLQHECPATNDLDVPHIGMGPVEMVEADARNRDLYKINNCTVNIAFERNGFADHIKCEDGKHCIANNTKVASYNWNQTVWYVQTVPGQPQESNGRAKVRFWQENGMGYLGISQKQLDSDGPITWELFNTGDEPHLDTFEIEVAPDSSALRLLLPDRSKQIHANPDPEGHEQTVFSLDTLGGDAHYDMRMAVLCCPSEGDWPLFLDDHESADTRFGTTGDIPFNASRRTHLCSRAEQAKKYYEKVVQSVEHVADDRSMADMSLSKAAKLHPHPNEWVLKQLPTCWNDCASPTVCVQTGDCRCVQADSCPRRRDNPLIALGRGLRQSEAPKMPSALGELGGYSRVLADMAAKVDWRDVLLPEARAYLTAHSDFIKLHVVSGYPKEEEIEAAECHKLQDKHCFSADSIMYKAMRHISVPAAEADLIVLPVYQHCTGAEFLLHDIWHYAATTIDGIDDQTKTVALVMTHDWGICLAFEWEIWSSRKDGKLYPDPLLKNTLVFSVMGDWDSKCYRPAQDVVIPPRTCNTPKLVKTFGDIHSVRPASERPRLLTWSGTFWGTGKNERLRLTCHRGGVAEKELLPGQGPQATFPLRWDNYLEELNSARFCPQPRGIAGWSPRVNDAIYAGCIPVLIAEASHYPFASMIDWSEISVRVHPTELDHIEQILNAIPLERVEQLQANIIAVREAFLYASDEEPEAELDRRGPMFFALHEAGMRMRTKYAQKS